MIPVEDISSSTVLEFRNLNCVNGGGYGSSLLVVWEHDDGVGGDFLVVLHGDFEFFLVSFDFFERDSEVESDAVLGLVFDEEKGELGA